MSTPLHVAASKGHLDIVKLFLEKEIETKESVKDNCEDNDDRDDEISFFDSINVDETKS